ncbi:MAG: fimbria major subunit [Muribaculum sp.]|nr:fimbria major subunit [Muribaculum sp.]
MFVRLISILFLASLIISACSSQEEPVWPDLKDETTGQYIRLRLFMPYSGSRSDSHTTAEEAFSNECKVNDITLFVYSGFNGLNSAGSTRFEEKFYLRADSNRFEQKKDTIDILFQATQYKIQNGDRLAAVINMGDCSGLNTLEDLQQYIPSGSWTAGGSLSDYGNFAMSNANSLDGEISVSVSGVAEYGSKENPFNVIMEVERMAARIDLDYSGSSREDDFLVYRARLANSEEVAKVYVSHVLPVNAMQEASYALKRISGPATDNFDCFASYTYTGALPKSGDLRPTAYVIEPHTTLKGLPVTDAEQWYGTSAASIIQDGSHGYFTDEKKLCHNLDNPSINIPSKSSVVIAYANENTQHINNHYAECLTGLVIRAQYVPYSIYTNSTLTEKIENPERGTDIWRYTPQNATTTEADVIYFANESAATEYSHAHSSDRAQIKSFPQGICYYNLWIRHTVLTNGNRPDGPVFPMEYGIVRNHIYRVAIGFRGIGREGVVIEDPWNIEPQIFVRPWNMFRHSTIIM